MATDGPTPNPCDREIFQSGEQVFITHTIPSNAMERWGKRVARLSGQRVDWHFAGGRAVVLAVGDLARVQAAVNLLMPLHDALQAVSTAEIEADLLELP